MRWILGIVLPWAITFSVVTFYWGKIGLLRYIKYDTRIEQERELARVSSRYEVMISAYKKMCFIRNTYDKEVSNLMGQISIHQMNIQKRAKSRAILAKQLRARNIQYGIGGGEVDIPKRKNNSEKRKKIIEKRKKNGEKRKKVEAGIVKTPKK